MTIVKKLEKINQEKILIWIIAVLAGIIIIISIFPDVAQKFPKLSSEKKYKVNAIELNGDCKECFELAPLTNNLKKDNIKMETETLDYNSEKAKKLIEKYGIKKIPALILTSKDIDKIEIDENVFSVGKNYAVFDKSVPYIELSSGQIKGLVEMKEISDAGCLECSSLSSIREQFEGTGVKIKNYEIVSSSSEAGKNLIKENKISFLPALLISKNLQEYWWIFSQIKNLLVENENYYVFKAPSYPYKELSTGIIRGKVEITYITNNSCLDCFNVTMLKESFQSLGVYIDKENYADISSEEGKNLLNIYNITAIPTVILSEEISVYEQIKKMLEEVGSFDNKKFVFRKLDVLNAKYQKIGG